MSPWTPSLPTEPSRWIAAALAIVAIAAMGRALRGRPHRLTYLFAPAAAAALSAGYVELYLDGAPRIIDATAYFLEARTLATGSWTLPITGPDASVLGRFLYGGQGEAAVIFPPGYPAVLAAGFWVGAPMAVGPVLAAALTFATMDLARRLPLPELQVGPAVTLAAVTSVACATLRYHTADTMSHGLAALCVTVIASAAIRLPTRGMAAPCALGAAFGVLSATRPVTAVAALVIALPAASRLRRAQLWAAVLAASPGVALWLGYQHAATGSPLGAAQLAYYATSDGPPGCFSPGWGPSVGCLGEHGHFLRERMPGGVTLSALLGTTGRRLALHAGDAYACIPAFALVIAGIAAARRTRLRAIAAFPPALVLAYAPFYFDGNIPGGGARLLADALGIEHVLGAFGLASLAERRAHPAAFFARGGALLIATALAGFAFWTGAHHEHLRSRHGGQPMFDPSEVPDGDMVFVDTDHGFNLAYDPTGARPVARHRGDVLDWLAWHARGRPRPWRYRFDFTEERAEPSLEPMSFGNRDRLEGESLWPAAGQEGGWAWPEPAEPPCASGGRALIIRPTPHAHITLAIPDALRGEAVAPIVATDEPAAATLALTAGGTVHRWSLARRGGCQRLSAATVPDGADPRLVVDTRTRLRLDVLTLPQNR